MPAREEDATYVPHIPAGGIARRLFQALQEEAASWDGCQVAALLMYLVEGDNRSDARTLASAASHVLHIQQGMRLYLRSREQSG